MSDPIVIQSLAVKHTAGFPNERLRPMKFCPGLNIIIGPNASGKTTTARTLQTILWPQTGQPETYLIAELAYQQQQGRIVYAGGRCTVDAALGLPAFGDASISRRYMLAQHELLVAQETGEDFARSILKEARGGIDLEQARQSLGYCVPSLTRAPKDYQNALRTYRAAKASESTLQHDETRIDELTRLLAAAEEAKGSSQRLLLTLEFQAHTEKVAQLTVALAEYPPELAALTGNELRELDGYANELTSIQSQRENTQREREAATTEMQRTNIVDPDATEQTVASVRGLYDHAVALEQQIGIARTEQQSAESEAKSAYANLGAEHLDAYADPLAASTVTELEGFVRSVEGIQARLEGVKAQGNWLDSITTPADVLAPDILQQTIRILRQWMITAPESARPAPWLPIAGLLAGALVIIAGLLATVAEKSLFGVLAILGGIATIVFFQMLRRKALPGNSRTVLEQQIAGLHVAGPDTWMPSDVEQFLHALETRLTSQELREKTTTKRQELKLLEQQVIEEMTSLEPERARIAAELGVDPARAYAHGNVGLFYFVTQLLRWQLQRAMAKKTAAKLEKLESTLRETLAQASALLAPHAFAPTTTAGEIRLFVQLLDDRRMTYLQADKDIQTAEQLLQAQEKHTTDINQKRAELLERLALDMNPEVARQQLTLLLPQLDAYRATERQLNDATAVRNETKRKGQQYSEWETLIAYTHDDLQQKYKVANEQVDNIANLSSEKAQCESRIANAIALAACETAQAELDRSEGKLGERFEQALHAAVGDFLIRKLNASTMDASLPEVFLHARNRFAEYTNGRYELRVNRDYQQFRAFDTVDNEERTLDQLSSATRIQLLMAVRVAFVERSEQGIALPFFMDETLACSDATRERAVINTMLQVCRNGRQVFYFTSKPYEAATWETLAKEAGVPIQITRLDETAEDMVIPPLTRITQNIPTPADMSHEAYGIALRVPRLDFARDTATSSHIWYVLDDPEKLYTLLSDGITTCGQLCNLTLRSYIQEVLGESIMSKALALAELLTHIETLWQEGRSQLLTPFALEETGMLTTDTFRKDITEIAEQCHWDARKLLAQLQNGRVKRLRTENIDRFVKYCEEHEYLVDGEILTPELLSDRLLGDAASLISQQVLRAGEVRMLCDRVLR